MKEEIKTALGTYEVLAKQAENDENIQSPKKMFRFLYVRISNLIYTWHLQLIADNPAREFQEVLDYLLALIEAIYSRLQKSKRLSGRFQVFYDIYMAYQQLVHFVETLLLVRPQNVIFVQN